MRAVIRNLFLLGILSTAFGQEFFNSGSASVLPKGRWELGVFQPLHYGVSTKVEASTYPLTFFIMPNGAIKLAHGSMKGVTFATRHSIYYPTILLRAITKKGTGGLISPEFKIPQMICFNNEVLATRSMIAEISMTLSIGFSVGLRSGKLDERATIDLPLIYPRLNPLFYGFSSHAGFALHGRLWRRWQWFGDADLFYCPAAIGQSAFEHKGLLLWSKSQKVQVCIGYKLVYGEYPFGSQWHLLGPLVDVQWGWGGKL